PLPLPYEQWVRVLMGIYDALPNETGQQVALEWCANHFKPGESPQRILEQKWKSFSSVTAVSVGTLVHIAKSYGWARPSALPRWKPTQAHATRKAAQLPIAPPAEWQEQASLAAIDCMTELQRGYGAGDGSPASHAAVWLQKRGIDAATAGAWGLGFNAHWRDVAGEKLAPGITIPCYGDSENGTALWYLKVRTSKAAHAKTGQKYLLLKGSKNNVLYNAKATLKARRVVIVEGEFDCILASRFTDNATAVVTEGAAGHMPNRFWLGYIAAHSDVAIFQDSDKAGEHSAQKWARQFPTAVALTLPSGQDVTDYWKSGGDVGAWLGRGATA
ncbi:MAG: PriCT-2 domain-containing protein, partial [Anaerolineales bacterium]|nr:PriCT-2 domain-containing protein [Anaerolineales bacterium]